MDLLFNDKELATIERYRERSAAARLPLVTRAQLLARNACTVGLDCFDRMAMHAGRDAFELQQLLDFLATCPDEVDPEALRWWYAHWLMAEYGATNDVRRLPRTLTDAHLYAAGSVVVDGDLIAKGHVIVAKGLEVRGDLDAEFVQIGGHLQVAGSIRTRHRLQAASIKAGGEILAGAFIHTDGGDIEAGGDIAARGDLVADRGAVRTPADVKCDGEFLARDQAIGGRLVASAPCSAAEPVTLVPRLSRRELRVALRLAKLQR